MYLVVSLPALLAAGAPLAWRAPITALVLLLHVLTFGYVGAERIWYLRIWRGRETKLGEVATYARRFLRRYFGLALIVAIPFVLLLVGTGLFGDEVEVSSWPNVLLTFLVHLAITFATPALAYSTADPGEALRIGFRFIRDHWPISAWYMVVPSLVAIVIFQRFTAVSTSWWPDLLLPVLSMLANLLFKGGTAAFYLRHVHDVPDDGAVVAVDDREAQADEPPRTIAL